MAVNLKEISPIVTFVSSFASTKDASAPAAFLWFSKGRVRAFSGISGATWRGVPEDLEFAVQAEGLASFLASLATSHQTAELKVTETRLSIRAGSFNAKLPLWADEAPREWLEREAPADTVELGPTFWPDVASVRGASSTDPGKPALCGVYWASDGSFMAADNLRASHCFGKGVTPPKGVGILIPAHLLSTIGSLPNFPRAAVGDAEIWFTSPGGEVHGQFYEAKFPSAALGAVFAAARNAMNEGVSKSIEAPTAAAVVDRLLLFANKPPYRIEVETGEATLRLWVAESEGNGKAAEEFVDAKVSGAPARFSTDGKLFREALDVSKTFHFADRAPLYFRSGDGRVEHILSLLA